MNEPIRRTFRVSFDIELTLNAIDDQVIDAVRQRTLVVGDDDYLPEFIRRDQALQHALLAHPAVVSAYLRHRAAETAEWVHPDDQSLQTIQAGFDDAALLEQVKEDLAAEDYTFLKGACDDDIFYDNTSFFEEAISIRQTNFTIDLLDDEKT